MRGNLPPEPPASEITPEPVYLKRREFLERSAFFAGSAVIVGGGLLALMEGGPPPAVAPDSPPVPPLPPLGVPVRPLKQPDGPVSFSGAASDGPRGRTEAAAGKRTQSSKLPSTASRQPTASSSEMSENLPALPDSGVPPVEPVPASSQYDTDEPKTSLRDVTSYNNFYEFGTGKEDPARTAGSLQVRPWTIAIEGEVRHPQVVDIDLLLRWFPLEERVYRMRCVEGWSMVIPWAGFPLGALLARVEPTSKANFVAFETLYDPKQMPGQRSRTLDWPYVEGLRLDEAMNPLTLLAAGLYGKSLPPQNGAPLRLVVPWKYGFKGIKSIVKIRLTEAQPATSWNQAAPAEYGFYANVNPAVDHPRWSQATERRIGEWQRRNTLPFNGYAEQVAKLYDGMDLVRNF